MKPLGSQWIMELHAHMHVIPEIIKNSFRAAGITDLLNASVHHVYNISSITAICKYSTSIAHDCYII